MELSHFWRAKNPERAADDALHRELLGKGDRESLGKLFADWMEPGLKSAMAKGLNCHDAEDACQETVLRFLRKRENGGETLDGPRPIASHFYYLKWEVKAQQSASYVGQGEHTSKPNAADTRPKVVVSTTAAELASESLRLRTAYDDDPPNVLGEMLARSTVWRSLGEKKRTIAWIAARESLPVRNSGSKRRIDWKAVSAQVSEALGYHVRKGACKKCWDRMKPGLQAELCQILRRHPTLARKLPPFDEKRPQESETPVTH